MENKLNPSFDDEDNNPFSQKNDHEEEESILLYKSNSNGSKIKDTTNSIQINHQSRVSNLLKHNSNVKIQITEANNSSEGMVNSSKKYIVYTIKLINDDTKEEIQIRRRYSDFESLREILTKIFPLLIIPPIPPKNYLNFSVLNNLVSSKNNGTTNKRDTNDYSYINSTHLNSNKLIEHRKRLLSNFLNNCLSIPKIRNLEFFNKFLDPNTNWTDEINLVNSQLPKDIYHSNPENGLKTDAIYANLPNPVSNHPISMSFLKPLQSKKLTKLLPDHTNNGNGTSGNGTSGHVTASNGTNVIAGNGSNGNHVNGSDEADESNENGSENEDLPSPSDSSDNLAQEKPINTSGLDKINRKIMDNFIGVASDYTELGTVFNSFSLILSDAPIVRAKKSEDQENSKLNIILDKMGQVFDRSYITINALINDLETKFSEPLGEEVQYTSILNFIQRFQSKKLKQKRLLDSEIKDKKQTLDELLKSEEEGKRLDSSPKNDAMAKNNQSEIEPKKSKLKMFSNMNSIKKITQYVTDIMDQNPVETRKQRITDLQNKIVTLEKCQGIMLEDISYISDELGKNVKLFHNKQLKVIYEILLCYNGFLVNWAKKNIEIWEEIRGEIISL
ncbi:sorting nexin-41 [[Candida] jaroonii]|uniref:Sorting nexin-41 n=1 Tax=[Candida] jaroonii TaxID=467808 RepID=A0ACA9YEX2_9ASCO|nr:sorting nexin-41 [[Candida] jaroonii]